MLAILEPGRFLFLLPLCLAIALVTTAARHDDLRGVLRHALRSFAATLLGILLFMAALSWLFEWLLPGPDQASRHGRVGLNHERPCESPAAGAPMEVRAGLPGADGARGSTTKDEGAGAPDRPQSAAW